MKGKPTKGHLQRGERIALPYFRCRIREYKYDGTYRICRPERKNKIGQWESYWQVEQTVFSNPKGLSDCVFYYNRKAQRIINLNALENAKMRRENVQRRKVRKEFKSWVDKRFEYLGDIYREKNTTIYPGGMDDGMNGREYENPFYRWVPSYLREMDMEDELSVYKEKKQSLGVKW